MTCIGTDAEQLPVTESFIKTVPWSERYHVCKAQSIYLPYQQLYQTWNHVETSTIACGLQDCAWHTHRLPETGGNTGSDGVVAHHSWRDDLLLYAICDTLRIDGVARD